MRFRKSCFCRQNVEWNAPGSYRLSGPERKRRRDLVQGVPRESTPGQAPQQRRRDALPLERTPKALELGLEGGDGAGGHLRGDQAPPEVGSDRRIPVTPAREQLGAAL